MSVKINHVPHCRCADTVMDTACRVVEPEPVKPTVNARAPKPPRRKRHQGYFVS